MAGNAGRDRLQHQRQAGHLMVGFYFHSIMVIKGHQMDVLKQIPLNVYADLFMDATPQEAAAQTELEELHRQLRVMQEKSMQIIQSLTLADLDAPLQLSPTPHPIARNQFEGEAYPVALRPDRYAEARC